jgi:DNA-binding CsgD family transcriptional regulator
MTEDVRHSEQFLRTAINAITNPFAVIDADDYTIKIANKAYGGDKVIGEKCYAVSHQQDTPCTGRDYPCSILEVKKTGAPYIGEHVHHDRQGNLLNMEIYAYPVSNRNGHTLQVIEYQIDITERRQRERELKHKAAELEEMNTALKVLLKRREQDKEEIEEKIFANFQLLLSPVLYNLEKTLTKEKQQEMIDILKTELKNILTPFSKKLSDKMVNLTPREIHVADLIKLGKSNKEISQILGCSDNTIARHRDNIRKKTGLKNKKINLRSFLLTLE